MGVDKARVEDRAWRIPERAFFGLALIGGSFGVLLGGVVFHHKTRKVGFMAVVFAEVMLRSALLFLAERQFGGHARVGVKKSRHLPRELSRGLLLTKNERVDFVHLICRRAEDGRLLL